MGRGQIHMAHFKFWGPNDISVTAKASGQYLHIGIDYIKY